LHKPIGSIPTGIEFLVFLYCNCDNGQNYVFDHAESIDDIFDAIRRAPYAIYNMRQKNLYLYKINFLKVIKFYFFVIILLKLAGYGTSYISLNSIFKELFNDI